VERPPSKSTLTLDFLDRKLGIAARRSLNAPKGIEVRAFVHNLHHCLAPPVIWWCRDERSWQGTVWPRTSTRRSADSPEVAKDQFKAVWERFYASLTPEDIEP
jgi:hypothetical protein